MGQAEREWVRSLVKKYKPCGEAQHQAEKAMEESKGKKDFDFEAWQQLHILCCPICLPRGSMVTRECDLGYLEGEEELADIGPSWQIIIGGQDVNYIICAEFGFAEEVINLISYKDGDYEVGIGESLRPYDERYKGDKLEDAKEAFEKALKFSLE